ncbi:3-isopropylmalate dehydratase large subunit [Bordetella genomosp. 5]|uniref:3-isopropylmalate dehydratase large subunit n=1 Tax=Bordetella genomosp. 5 TaxID=1395608 RepID=UPI000B9E8C1B|nr:3-isopropylmalate dehydratase large subunit [Bordetella genomosp. 5]OZI33501.1 3-isopropylmalate dehydratase large subunit [Bordetella genomosp. 5]
MTGSTLYDKLVASHEVARLDDEHVLLYVDLHIMNEYTSPQAFSGLAARGREVLRPRQQMAVVDHVIPTHPVAARDRVIVQDDAALQARNLKRNCDAQGIALFDTTDPLQGIEHVIAPEHGMILPGMVVLCGDSHTTTYGALGALGFGIGTSEVEHILATQTLVYRVARNMRVRVDGALGPGVSAKDLVIYIVHRIGAQGAVGYAVELCGTTIAALSAEARMTVCNMLVEAGARAALIAPDAITDAYVSARALHLTPEELRDARHSWASLHSDADAVYDREFTIDAAGIAPYVTWGTSPDQALPVDAVVPDPEAAGDALQALAARKALDYVGLQAGQPIAGVPIDRVFIGSCTNARIEDLRSVAEIVQGRHVAPGVRAMVVPGSGAVRDQAHDEGLDRILIDAGFEWRQPGCSMCLAMNDDMLAPGERCASTTNRNFEGRQGRAGRTHLMSPAMAAAAALTGRITDVRTIDAQLAAGAAR